MVSNGLSEFSFGFGYLHEQIVRLRQQSLADGTRLTGAPIFPSQQFEAVRGYDVYLPKFGTDYYYQFKASEYFSHPRSRWRADGTHTGPYYRIALHKANYNQQHRRLRALAVDKEHTYYVAPEFNSWERYNTAFLEGTITENSRKIPLQNCDDILDGGKHYITFQSGNEGWEQHSDSKHHDGSILGKEIFSVYMKHKPDWKRIDDQYASNLFSEISDTAKKIVTKKQFDEITDKINVRRESFEYPVMSENHHMPRKVETLIKTSQILSILFGATLFLVGSQDSNSGQNQ
jgi:hypothetical protein